MTRYFTHYWKNDTWQFNSDFNNEALDHIAGNLFSQRGVSSGDIIYVVTVIKGRLFVCGSLQVEKICDVYQAAQFLGTSIDELWEAEEHIVASKATPTNFQLEIPLEVTQRLKFKGSKGLKGLAFSSPGYLDQQTLRGFRELDSESAIELDQVLSSFGLTAGYQQLPKQEPTAGEETLPEEVLEEKEYYEGATKRIIINAYERNAKARHECIAHYGNSCSVCNFSFGDTYPGLGEGYIHVHHRIPLANIGKKYKLDPIKDLRPVCPNCHAMLHQRKPPYEVEELKSFLKK